MTEERVGAQGPGSGKNEGVHEPLEEEPEGARVNDDEEDLEDVSEEFVESFLGKRRIPHEEKKTSVRFWLGCLKVLIGLIFPSANQRIFTVGFWVLRAAGLIVFCSWIYYGLSDGVWDTLKGWTALAVLLVGPLVLRGVEFVLESFLLRGATRESWKNFWNFRRMMTPRSIQTAFFIGFWLLVLSGGLAVVSGFTDLVRRERLRDAQGRAFISTQTLAETVNLLGEIRETSGEHMADVVETLSPAAREALRTLRTTENITTETLADERTAAGLEEIFYRYVGDPTLEILGGKKTDSNPYLKILAGLLSMVLGPLALRFTCEWIILLFRVNETLTDISKQLDGISRTMHKDDSES